MSDDAPLYTEANSPQPLRPGGVATAIDRSPARVLLVGRAMIILVTVVLVMLLGRVVQLQTHPEERLAAKLNSQQSTTNLSGRRGTILDRNGRVLATTRVAEKLFVDPLLIIEHSSFSEKVGYGLGYDPVDIELALAVRPKSRYIVLDRRLDDQRIELLKTLDLPGLATDPFLTRDYPQGQLAGQLIGFVGADGKGLEGLEKFYNKRITATDGRVRYQRDARGRALWVKSGDYQRPDDGESLRLSIDVVIQSIAEASLAEAVEKYQAESGQLVVMDPSTGEVLAMANYPSFDPATFNKVKPEVRRNRAVTDVFEPGSIFKPIIWSAATQLGAADSNEIIDTTESGVYRTSKGRRLHDARGHGKITWDEVLIYSSNIGMAIVAERVGAEKLREAVVRFGFGRPTGSGLPGEVGGVVHPLKKWTHYSVTSVPMGQELSVTPLQMVRAFSAIANGGVLLTPTVVPVFGPSSGSVPADIQGVRVLDQRIADYTRSVLRRQVTEGGGQKANSKLYDLFGKTGTAQLPNFKQGGYYQDQYVSSFIAGAPADSPRLVVGCFIHKPDKTIGHYGGTVSAPAVKRVMEQSLMYLGVPTNASKDAQGGLRPMVMSR
jgi:cell division protein FtsI (penicillin-binding protein 3)